MSESRGPQRRSGWRGNAWAAGLAGLAAFAGCAPASGTVPVRGRVTFGGLPPPSGCLVNFLPKDVVLPRAGDERALPRVTGGCGECDATGAFVVFGPARSLGLRPGGYEVRVSSFLPPEDPAGEPVSLVPGDFVPPELVVPAGAGGVRYDVDVPLRGRK